MTDDISPRPHSASQWWAGDALALPLASSPPEVLLKGDFLNPHACAELITCFNRNRRVAPSVGMPYWDGRFVWSSSLPADREAYALRILQRVRQAAGTAIALHFGLTRRLYSDTVQIVHWPIGQSLTPHADNVEPGGQPNYTAHRAYSAVVYLNDDYTGGHTFFPFLNARVQPKTGSLLAFRSGAAHVHGVTRVEGCDRYTCAAWYTFDAAKEDPQARILY